MHASVETMHPEVTTLGHRWLGFALAFAALTIWSGWFAR